MRTKFNRRYTFRATPEAKAHTQTLFDACQSLGWNVNKQFVNEGVKKGYEVGVVYQHGMSPKTEIRDSLLDGIRKYLVNQGVPFKAIYWYLAEDENVGFKYIRVHMDLQH